MKKIFVILSFLIVIFSFTIIREKYYEKIVIVNIGEFDRNGIAEEIKLIRECNPKVIAIYAYFVSDKGVSDSLLVKEINATPNIILPYKLSNDHNHILKNDAKFESQRKIECIGYFSVFDSNNKAIGFKPMLSIDNKNYFSLPVAISHVYDSTLTNKFLNDNRDQTVYTDYWGDKDKFRCIEVRDLIEGKISKKQLEDKIVLIGYTGPSNEDLLMISDKKYQEMYSTIMVANIVRMILK